jgi:YesN/AraC family two-component response regulator
MGTRFGQPRHWQAIHLGQRVDEPVPVVRKLAVEHDQFYFSRQFRQTHGESPSAYRARRKG